MNIFNHLKEEIEWKSSLDERETFVKSKVFKDLEQYFNFVLSAELVSMIAKEGTELIKTQGRCEVLSDILPTLKDNLLIVNEDNTKLK